MLILALGLWAAWKENRPAMAAFIVGMLAAAGYFIFKTTRVWKERTQAEFATDYKVRWRSSPQVPVLTPELPSWLVPHGLLESFARHSRVDYRRW